MSDSKPVENLSGFEKFRHSPTVILWICSFGLFMEEFLYGMVIPLTTQAPAHIRDEHVISELYAAYALGLIIATPILGLITDRLGRRKPMILGGILLGVSAVLFWLGASKEMLFIARILQGAGAACTWTAGLALVAGYFVKGRVKAMGYMMLGATSGSCVGPLVGGWMFDKTGYDIPYYSVFVFLLLDICLRFVIPAHKRVVALAAWKETFREVGGILTDKSVLSSAFAVSLAATSWALMEPLFPMHIMKMGTTSPTIIGALFTASNLVYAFMTSAVSNTTEAIGVRQTTLIGLVVTAVSLPMLAFAPNLLLSSVVLCLVTAGYAFTMNPASAELGDAVDRRGSTSYAIAYAVYNLAYSFGMIGADWYVEFATDAAHKLEFLHILLIMSGLLLLCVPLFWFKNSSEQELVPTESEG